MHLYRHYAEDGTLLYIGISLSFVQRLSQHHSHAHWFEQIRRVEIEKFSTREEARDAERKAIIKEQPLFNIQFSKRVKQNEAAVIKKKDDENVFLYVIDSAGPKWVRTFAVDLDKGTIFLPCVALGEDVSEEQAFMLAAYDGVCVIVDGEHRYYPTDWIKREFPSETQFIEKAEAKIREWKALEKII